MDKADRSSLGLALLAHALLFAALTISIARRRPPVHAEPAAMDVQLVDTIGLKSAAPAPATEAPRQAEAPELGPPAEQPPAPAAPAPKAAETPPTPAPSLKPAPAKDAGVTPSKAAPAKASPRLSSDFLRDLPAARPGKAATAQRIGADFLKGLPTPTAGRGEHARAALAGAAMNGLVAALKRQVQPCYELGGLAGTPAMQIVTILRLRYNKDGTVAGSPQVVDQSGVTAANRAYAQQIADVARRAVLRCAPVRLPAEYYEGGWDDLDFRFTPGQMS